MKKNTPEYKFPPHFSNIWKNRNSWLLNKWHRKFLHNDWSKEIPKQLQIEKKFSAKFHVVNFSNVRLKSFKTAKSRS